MRERSSDVKKDQSCAASSAELYTNAGTELFVPDSGAGYNYADPSFAIDWPIKDNIIISEKDRNLPFINISSGEKYYG